ncbi:SRPBCC family protein [Nocardia wallacei]|uniref:SRPBCC family protein n=1 Tax=Nocardia wallacei TaxID=480035 RepID=UPI0024570677|nr:SRPBCC family protein [Nocardia wallacei]
MNTDVRKPLRFSLEPIPAERTDDYLATAPVSVTVHAELPAPPATVFAALVDESCFSWLPGVSGFRYDGAHRGVGATRVLLNPLLTVREEFTAYAEGERLDYTFTAMSVPAFASSVESYELQPISQNSTLLTVRVGAVPRIPAPRWITRPLQRSFTARAVRGLARAVAPAGGSAPS